MMVRRASRFGQYPVGSQRPSQATSGAAACDQPILRPTGGSTMPTVPEDVPPEADAARAGC